MNVGTAGVRRVFNGVCWGSGALSVCDIMPLSLSVGHDGAAVAAPLTSISAVATNAIVCTRSPRRGCRS